MRKIFIFSLIVMLFVIGCARDLPPEPKLPNAPIGKATGLYPGYAPTYDVFDNNKELFSLTFSETNEFMTLKPKVEQIAGYVYKFGYVYTVTGWKKFEFTQTTVKNSNWIRKVANTSLSVPLKLLKPGDNYILTHSCKRYDDKWRCGCRDKTNCGYWMLKLFQVSKKADLSVSEIRFNEHLLNNKLGVTPDVGIDNIGNKESGVFKLVGYINGVKKFTREDLNLEPGKGIAVSDGSMFFDYATHNDKEYEIRFVVDPENKIVEYNNANNELKANVTITEHLPSQEPIVPANDTTITTECTDTDGGKNYYVKGTVSGMTLPGNYYASSNDSCEGNTLHEGYCLDSSENVIQHFGYQQQRALWRYECPGGCKDGACIGGSFALQIKRTNPGIAKYKSAEIIFDAVNTKLEHFAEGFLVCISPDGATVSSSLGAGVGPGGQYVSPIFVMDTGPSQKAMSVTVDSDTTGDKRTDCKLKYIHFKKENTTNDKLYLKMNGEYSNSPGDSDYREIRMMKTVSFIELNQTGCTDTDGNNKFTKGQVVFNGKTTVDSCEYDGQKVDSCIGESCVVEEHLCKDGTIPQTVVAKCPNGCRLGACRINNTCDIKDTLNEGETKHYTGDGKDYAIKAYRISPIVYKTVTFIVNGEITFKLLEGDSFTLMDGSEITVTELQTPPEYQEDLVEFCFKKGTRIENRLDYFTLGATSVAYNTDFSLLGSGTIINDKGTFKYNEKIDNLGGKVKFDVNADKSDDPALYFDFSDYTNIYTYYMMFEKPLKSDVDENNKLNDLMHKKITMLGQDFSVINAEMMDQFQLKLDLMSGTLVDTIQEGETRTYTIDGIDYEVECLVVTDTGTKYAQLKIKEETTDKLMEGSTYKLSDGTEVGIKSILRNEAGDVTGDIVEFYLGAKKITFIDSLSLSHNGKYEVGGLEIPDIKVEILGKRNNDEVLIDYISVTWEPADDHYVGIDDQLSETFSYENDKEKLFLQAFDFAFPGVDYGKKDTIEIIPSSTSKYKLKMTTKTGGNLNDVVYYSDAKGDVRMGYSDSKKLYVKEGDVISKNNFFITEANGYSHLLQLLSFDVINKKVKIKDVGLGTTFEVTSNETGATTFYLDGKGFSVTADFTAETLTLDNIAADPEDTQADLWSANGARVVLETNEIPNLLDIKGKITVYEDENYIQVILSDADLTTTDSNKMTLETPTSDSDDFNMMTLDSNSETKQAYTGYGTFVEFKDPVDSQAKVTMIYPEHKANYLVYLMNSRCTTWADTDVETGQTDAMFSCS